MKLNRRSAQALYTLIHILYWITNCAMFSYAGVFLLDKGFTNAQIGIVLALCYGCSFCLQPTIAALIQRYRIRMNVGIIAVYVLAILFTLAMLVLVPGKGLLAALFVGALSLHSAVQPAVNALVREMALVNVQVNFGLSRGVGSAAFSLASAVIGSLLSGRPVMLLPVLYLVTMVLLIVVLLLFRAPASSQQAEAASKSSTLGILKRNPHFVLFLLGVACLFLPHMFIDNFMNQIMHSLGGDSSHQGVAIAIAGLLELPAMIFYSRLSRRFGCRRMILLVGWVWMFKDLITLLATGPVGIYLSEVLQIGSFALYVPAMVEYVSIALPPEDFLKGQALAGSAWMLGSLLATSLGGTLIDGMGVKPALMVVQVFAIAGAVFFTLAVRKGTPLETESE